MTTDITLYLHLNLYDLERDRDGIDGRRNYGSMRVREEEEGDCLKGLSGNKLSIVVGIRRDGGVLE